MLTKAQLKARENGAVVRGNPGEKYRLNNTNYFIFISDNYRAYGQYGQPSFVQIGNVTLTIVKLPSAKSFGRVEGNVPASWFIDLNAPCELEDEDTEELQGALI